MQILKVKEWLQQRNTRVFTIHKPRQLNISQATMKIFAASIGINSSELDEMMDKTTNDYFKKVK